MLGKETLTQKRDTPLAVPKTLNQSCSIDFMSDSLFCGHHCRTFNVVNDFNDFNQEALAIKIDLSLPSLCILRVLERIAAR